MNKSLFMSMVKTNGKSIFGFTFGSLAYIAMVILIYPTIANSDSLNDALEQMPEDFLKAFGFDQGMPDNVVGFAAGEYYSLFFILILLIFCVLTANRLMARLVDHGSIAYLLTTATSRTRIAITQASVLIVGLIIIMVFTTISGFLFSSFVLEDAEMNTVAFLHMNLVGFLLFFAISGYCFLFSCLVNDEKRALAISGGISILFFAMDMVGKISTDLEILRNFSIFATFQPSEIAKESFNVLPVSLGLAAAGIVLFAVSIFIFRRRDLPL